jgi:hypothetical protein
MSSDLQILLATAASVGFVHTLAGPDHYLPFVVMARARGWSLARALTITFLCGLGHVGSSVLLGVLGIGLGVAATHLSWIEAVRGEAATWLLIAFGLAYMVWGLRRAVRDEPHRHLHAHADGHVHEHDHGHDTGHGHVHDEGHARSLTPWVLFTVLVLGPCEPLIPLLMYPALRTQPAAPATAWVATAQQTTWEVVRLSAWPLALVTVTFGVVTIGAMLAAVYLTLLGIKAIQLRALERFSHALAGAAILATGLAVLCLGL